MTAQDPAMPPPTVGGATIRSRPLRHLLMGFGWVNVALGAIGVVVPGLPTTPFLLVAAWAFSKSSPRFQNWLRYHPRFGPPVRDWQDHGAVPVKAKILAVVMMAASLAYIVYAADSWAPPAIIGAIMLCAASYVVTRPSRPR